MHRELGTSLVVSTLLSSGPIGAEVDRQMLGRKSAGKSTAGNDILVRQKPEIIAWQNAGSILPFPLPLLETSVVPKRQHALATMAGHIERTP